MEVLEKEIYKRYQAIVESLGCAPRFGALPEPKTVKLSQIIDCYDAFCFDGYGTLYNRGDFVYPGAMEWYRELRAARKQLRLVTNAASNLDEVLAGEAAARGFDFTAAETVSSGSLLKSALLSKAVSTSGTVREVFYIGRATGVNVLNACGIDSVENPELPVVAVSSSTATDEMYAHAVEILRRPGSLLLLLNSDAWAPKIDGGRQPVSGALAERLRRDSVCESNNFEGCRVEYFGKPFPAIWNKVKSTLPEGSRVLMIGDTLGTDVYGAYVAGFDSALVVGRNEPCAELAEDEEFLGVRPTYYLVP